MSSVHLTPYFSLKITELKVSEVSTNKTNTTADTTPDTTPGTTPDTTPEHTAAILFACPIEVFQVQRMGPNPKAGAGATDRNVNSASASP